MLAIGRSQPTAVEKTTIPILAVQYTNRALRLTEKPASVPVRLAFLVAGFSFVFLAFLGALLPVLPTTPFLILASSCFMRSSPKWQAWLLRLPVWGLILRDWEAHRAVKPGTKRLAMFVLATAFLVTTLSSHFSPIALILFLVFVLIGATVIWRLPVIRNNHKSIRVEKTKPVW